MPEALEKLNELGTLITNIQKSNDSLEKKFDVLESEKLKKMSEAATSIAEGFQKQKEENEKQAEKINQLEKRIVMLNGGDGKSNPAYKEYTHQFNRYLKTGIPIETSLVGKINEAFVKTHYTGLTDDQVDACVKSLSVQINPDGGYWVKPEMLTTTVDRVFETSPMRSVASVITTSNDSVEMIIDDDQADTGGWVGEKTPRPETGTPQIGLLTIMAYEQYANPAITQKLLDDAGFNVEAWLAAKVEDKLLRQENISFITGNGNLKPKGILGYAAWASTAYERNAVEQVNSGTSGDFDADNLIGLQNKVIEEYQPNAKWLMKRQTWGKVLLLKEATTGAYLINPQLIKEGTDLRLLGNQVKFMSSMNTSGAANALSIAYGDFKRGYTIVDRIGMRTLRDPYTNKPYVHFYTTKRVGGAVTNYEAFKILKEAV